MTESRRDNARHITARISAEKLAAKVGRTLDVLIDAVDTMPSFAPITAARSQPMRDVACDSAR